MKILIITDIQQMGGQTTYLENLISTIASKKCEVILLAASTEKAEVVNLGNSQRYIFFVKNLLSIKYIFVRVYWIYKYLQIILNKNSIDYIILDLFNPALSFFVAKFFLPNIIIPVYYQFHGSFSLELFSTKSESERTVLERLKTVTRSIIEKKIYNRVNRIICFSEYSKKILIQKYEVNSEILIAKPGVDSLLLKKAKITKNNARKKIGFSSDAKILVIASRIEKRKGVEHFLKQLIDSSKLLKEITLIICTNMNIMSDDFLMYLNNTNLSSRIYIKNKVDIETLSYIYKSADLVILPSLELETFGFTTLESMSLGTPVLAYSIGANSELIPEILLNKISEKDSLIEKIKWYFNLSSNQKNKLSALCFRKAKEFSWNKYYEQVFL